VNPRTAGRSLTPVLLVLLPILVIGFFFSVVEHAVLVAVILALLALATVIRLALTSRSAGK
jgi:hypothetical protein